jgi:hypothetical protein
MIIDTARRADRHDRGNKEPNYRALTVIKYKIDVPRLSYVNEW